MSIIIALWQQLPVVVRAGLAGLVVAAAGIGPWVVLLSLNTQYASAVPWAVPLNALYLWFFWRYCQGAGWPRSTAPARQRSARATALPDDVWASALLAGMLGLVAMVLGMSVFNRLVRLPAQVEDLSNLPFVTAALSVLMGSLVAGVVEETAFRGYMQGPIERRHGPVIAMLATGALFGVLHFTHQEMTILLMPFYMAIALIYGALAYLTNSILPGVVLHASGNVLGAMDFFARGRAVWQASPTPEPLVWETGTDVSFWISAVAALVTLAAAVRAYAALARDARTARAPVVTM